MIYIEKGYREKEQISQNQGRFSYWENTNCFMTYK